MPPSSSRRRSCRFVQPHLPDECWELIFKHLTDPHDHESLSLVSTHFLSLTNRIRTHLTISDGVIPLIPALLRRFPNLTSIKLSSCRYFTGNINALLSQIASFDLPSLHSLDISNEYTFPSNGLRQFSRKFPTLKSLNCSSMRPDLVLIAECFPKLEEIHVTFTSVYPETDLQVKALTSGLKKLRKVYLSGSYILQDSSIFTLCQNCVSLEALVVHQTDSLSKIANAIRERPQLRSLEARGGILTLELIDTLVSLNCLTCLHLSCSSISDEALCALADGVLPLRELSLWGFSGYQCSGISCLLRKCNNLECLDLQNTKFLNDECVIELSLLLGNLKVVKLGENANLTDLSLFAIMRNCPLIIEIRMERTSVGKHKVEEDCLVVNSHVKFLNLARNSCLNDESVKMIASVCPNLEIIDLTNCKRVSKGVIDILQRCCKIQRMNMICIGYDLPQFQIWVNFEVPTLLVLNLSRLSISDEELSLISKSCYNLKELEWDGCRKITASGVKKVVKNCKQLRKISLSGCGNVSSDIVAWMVLTRPSLREIITPQSSRHNVGDRDHFLRRGCFVHWVPKVRCQMLCGKKLSEP
ncbi:hypothetical protein PIB30_042207 [Stylosanthes scabra]|uniref:F-box domain-containing protein n=1 Tax=Stylosanthes scabra TaxID=79078 RepID=A0ABU6VHA3_9FABA|nr:hypothetical protein [Stylosanthes scabra]